MKRKEAKTKIEVFLTPAEIDRLEEQAAKANRSRSAMARELILLGIKLDAQSEADNA